MEESKHCTVGDQIGGQGISAPEHCIEDGCIKIENDSDPKMIHIKIFFSGVFQLKIWKIVIFHYIGLGSLGDSQILSNTQHKSCSH